MGLGALLDLLLHAAPTWLVQGQELSNRQPPPHRLGHHEARAPDPDGAGNHQMRRVKMKLLQWLPEPRKGRVGLQEVRL